MKNQRHWIAVSVAVLALLMLAAARFGSKTVVDTMHATTNYFPIVQGSHSNSVVRLIPPSNVVAVLNTVVLPRTNLAGLTVVGGITADTFNVNTQTATVLNLSTPLSMAAGGSGSSLTDPGAHAVWAWDNTNNSNRLATLSGITYDPTGNTLTAAGGGAATPGVNYVASAATIIIDLALTNAPMWTVTNAADSHLSLIISNPAPGRWFRFRVVGSGTATNNNLTWSAVTGVAIDWCARATNTSVVSNGFTVVSGVIDQTLPTTNATLAFRTEAQ